MVVTEVTQQLHLRVKIAAVGRRGDEATASAASAAGSRGGCVVWRCSYDRIRGQERTVGAEIGVMGGVTGRVDQQQHNLRGAGNIGDRYRPGRGTCKTEFGDLLRGRVFPEGCRPDPRGSVDRDRHGGIWKRGGVEFEI